ncbi:hypothetical protein LV779_27725 [Streptomyces thinghirensis]|nr:hypothetical protein [Streptomyces thinghirensis]
MRPAADAADAETLLARVPAGERVAVVDACAFVGHPHALRLGLTDPRFPLAAIPGAVTAQPDARQALTRAMARENSGHGGTARGGAPARAKPSVGDVGSPRRPDHRRPRRRRRGRPPTSSAAWSPPSPPTLRARNEARRGRRRRRRRSRRLKSAVKARDGFVTTFLISPYSRYVARWCARRGLTLNQVTTASLITALIAAGCAATGTRGGFVAAGVLLIASFVLDCTDGQLRPLLPAVLHTRRLAGRHLRPRQGVRLLPRASPSEPPAAATTYGPSPSARWSSRPAGTSSTSPSTRPTSTARPPPPTPAPPPPLSDRLDSVGWTGLGAAHDRPAHR